jgi:hypothetical protein
LIPLKQKNRYSCWGTAIASILNDPSDFPHERDGMTLKEAERNWGNHHSDVVNYLNSRGILLLAFTRLENAHELRCYHLISGKSPRGMLHTVVGKAGEIVHDPWSGEDTGLVSPKEEWQYELFICRNVGDVCFGVTPSGGER